MSFRDLFQVFSKRTASEGAVRRPLTETFRNRVLMRCRDLFAQDFWAEIHSKLTYLLGRPRLANLKTDSPMLEAFAFLHACDDENFLDFLEYVFQTQACFHARPETLVEDFNEFFRQDGLPYAMTHFVWTERQDGAYLSKTLTARPQVIRKDSDVLHCTAIQPVLQLLREPGFSAANTEFLEALEDFRRGDYGDCLTKCGSAFESALKVLCARKKWPYSPTDTASALLKTAVANSRLEAFFEQPLILVATIRNRLSKSHGAGLTSRDVTEAKAEYAINATAAAVLLLAKTCR